MATATITSSARSFGGRVLKYKHASATLGCDMVFSVFLPPAVTETSSPSIKVPAVVFLSGLTCNEDNFLTKAGAVQYAAKLGVALVCPDTSPRNVNCPDDATSWDFGQGASYYVDATTPEYAKHYRMYSYVTQEFHDLITSTLPIDKTRISLMGHSVGGHGALTLGLRNPHLYRAISAFAPMSNPTNCAWGVKAFSRFLGDSDNKQAWKQYDATEVVKAYNGRDVDVLVDQGTADTFLAEYLLTPRVVEAAKGNQRVHLEYRERDGYDHGYWYISTFVEEHLRWHAERLLQQQQH
ncbi:hypothetical protein BC828DRAFT_345669 [Blastocladiella britannica]|nr:hypothetical protein BC828DRAFT_345669 [Blastocladiella britannica]